MVTLETIRAAHDYLSSRIHRTPLVSAQLIGQMTEPRVRLLLKAEQLQKTGSFKPRGILYRLAHLTDDERVRGVITVSTGNTAQSLAWAARQQGVPCTVVVPTTAPRTKREAATGYGAEVITIGESMHQCWETADMLIATRGLTLVHPCDDPFLIAGHGTLGLEILEDCPEVDAVVVPVGGGALATGVAAAIKLVRPEVKVFGIEPKLAPKLSRALAQGQPVDIGVTATVADGLRTPVIGNLPFALARRYLDAVIQVSEEAIIEAMRLLLLRGKFLVEPAGAAPLGALLEGGVPIPAQALTVAILSGGNIDQSALFDLLGGKEA
ncbi:MAG: threonine ammonia-lyase [Ktedonobacterales bacterium]